MTSDEERVIAICRRIEAPLRRVLADLGRENFSPANLGAYLLGLAVHLMMTDPELTVESAIETASKLVRDERKDRSS